MRAATEDDMWHKITLLLLTLCLLGCNSTPPTNKAFYEAQRSTLAALESLKWPAPESIKREQIKELYLEFQSVKKTMAQAHLHHDGQTDESRSYSLLVDINDDLDHILQSLNGLTLAEQMPEEKVRLLRRQYTVAVEKFERHLQELKSTLDSEEG